MKTAHLCNIVLHEDCVIALTCVTLSCQFEQMILFTDIIHVSCSKLKLTMLMMSVTLRRFGILSDVIMCSV